MHSGDSSLDTLRRISSNLPRMKKIPWAGCEASYWGSSPLGALCSSSPAVALV